jgi:hypothetical protein
MKWPTISIACRESCMPSSSDIPVFSRIRTPYQVNRMLLGELALCGQRKK